MNKPLSKKERLETLKNREQRIEIYLRRLKEAEQNLRETREQIEILEKEIQREKLPELWDVYYDNHAGIRILIVPVGKNKMSWTGLDGDALRHWLVHEKMIDGLSAAEMKERLANFVFYKNISKEIKELL